MPITLEEAKVGMADKVDQAVIDTFRRESMRFLKEPGFFFFQPLHLTIQPQKLFSIQLDFFQIYRRESMLLDRLIFDDAVSPGTGGSTLTYGYQQLKTPSPFYLILFCPAGFPARRLLN